MNPWGDSGETDDTAETDAWGDREETVKYRGVLPRNRGVQLLHHVELLPGSIHLLEGLGFSVRV